MTIKPVHVVMADRLRETPAPSITDRLGRPLVGPCMIWTGATDRHGYGALGNREFGSTAIQRAHRAAYALAHGIPLLEIRSIPELDHLCRVHACCAALHLEPVSHAENVKRGDWQSPHLGKAECIRGHAFTPENTRYDSKSNMRVCRTCARDRQRAKYDPAARAAKHQAVKARRR